ncbi:segregation and condensation protein A [Clostridium formicaceticum]|uniref:Segregation and condensation protein A n=1 Tax=Clostridium formicaceticum TaxID=1497 RepID=A0AAC9RIB9_9CLOT|nr:segregation/condensation protein A [Clostridium formicaceticum]AOY77095.1 segregation/condensation protein A [Clostridium formicaceticum]ARE87604.1 Segregation and condensation protein A [Clostridium formicaceticum]
MSCRIKIQAFEGAFDLLFHLIEKNEIDIYDIPINEITEQYLHYLYQMEKLDLEVASEFLVMAATLIEIKSKMLLPKEVVKEDKVEAETVDPRSELVERLLEYKRYKCMAEELKQREDHYNKLYFKQKEEIIMETSEADVALENLKLDDLVKVFEKLLLNYEKHKNDRPYNVRHISRDTYTIEDKITSILTMLQHHKKITFDSIFILAKEKLEVVVTFLALLELIKGKKIKVMQEKSFEGIVIEGISN